LYGTHLTGTQTVPEVVVPEEEAVVPEAAVPDVPDVPDVPCEPDEPCAPDAPELAAALEDELPPESQLGHLHADSDATSATRAAQATIRRPMRSSR